jgi:GNAT superfamily N-acetyltransferase
MYHENWGRHGDVGFLAEIGERPVGAVWYRLFTEGRHGDGFVDEATPELAIAVVDGYRGRGIGGALLERIHAEAESQGLSRIALSVEADNPAKELYRRSGYRDLQQDDPKGRMILLLAD